jgi:hypothetical protein
LKQRQGLYLADDDDFGLKAVYADRDPVLVLLVLKVDYYPRGVFAVAYSGDPLEGEVTSPRRAFLASLMSGLTLDARTPITPTKTKEHSKRASNNRAAVFFNSFTKTF